MLIRELKTEDYEAVYRLWTNTPGMGLRTLDDTQEGIERFLARNPRTCFVAELDRQICGVILAGHDGRRGYIYHLAVDSRIRQKGIGTALVDRSLAALAEEKINKVALVVFEANEIGNRFWEARGFPRREDLVYRNKSINPLNS